jgi:hypothetical protein
VLTNTACAYLYSEPAQLFFVGLVNGFEAPLFIQLLVDFWVRTLTENFSPNEE